MRVPCTPSSREMLIEAGLGDKTISVPSCSSGEEFQSFQSSRMVGVLKFCGVSPTQKIWKLSRHLLHAQSAQLLKDSVGNGKIYLRPIQKNLDVCIDIDAVPQCEVSAYIRSHQT